MTVECCVCSEPTRLRFNCGHKVLCGQCFALNRKECPVCRATVVGLTWDDDSDYKVVDSWEMRVLYLLISAYIAHDPMLSPLPWCVSGGCNLLSMNLNYLLPYIWNLVIIEIIISCFWRNWQITPFELGMFIHTLNWKATHIWRAPFYALMIYRFEMNYMMNLYWRIYFFSTSLNMISCISSAFERLIREVDTFVLNELFWDRVAWCQKIVREELDRQVNIEQPVFDYDTPRTIIGMMCI